jgi:hypothetical protein
MSSLTSYFERSKQKTPESKSNALSVLLVAELAGVDCTRVKDSKTRNRTPNILAAQEFSTISFPYKQLL